MHSVLPNRHDGNNGDGAIGDSSPSPHSQRLCVVCEREISQARLKAIPTAAKCVQCVMDSGDVPRLRRHDQLIGTLETGEVVSTYYKKPTPYLATVLRKERAPLRCAINDEHDAPSFTYVPAQRYCSETVN